MIVAVAIYIDKSSLFGSGRKNDLTRSSVTSSMRGGFHFGLLSFVMSKARTPTRNKIEFT